MEVLFNSAAEDGQVLGKLSLPGLNVWPDTIKVCSIMRFPNIHKTLFVILLLDQILTVYLDILF
jgi:hypothetical protein